MQGPDRPTRRRHARTCNMILRKGPGQGERALSQLGLSRCTRPSLSRPMLSSRRTGRHRRTPRSGAMITHIPPMGHLPMSQPRWRPARLRLASRLEAQRLVSTKGSGRSISRRIRPVIHRRISPRIGSRISRITSSPAIRLIIHRRTMGLTRSATASRPRRRIQARLVLRPAIGAIRAGIPVPMRVLIRAPMPALPASRRTRSKRSRLG